MNCSDWRMLGSVPEETEEDVIARRVGDPHQAEDHDERREQEPIVAAHRERAVGERGGHRGGHVVVADPIEVGTAGARGLPALRRLVARDLAVRVVEHERELEQH